MNLNLWGKVPLNFKKTSKKTFCKAFQILGVPDDVEVDIGFCSQEEIQQMNKQTRNIDKPTDVLSFPNLSINNNALNFSGLEIEKNPETGNIMLGEIVICTEVAKKQAEEIGQSLMDEVLFLSVHGLLHLLGFDHEEKLDEEEMTEMQRKILN